MPLYEYRCKNCGASKDVLSGTDDDGPVCDCGSDMARQIGRPSFVFGGFMKVCDGTDKAREYHNYLMTDPGVKERLDSGASRLVTDDEWNDVRAKEKASHGR